MNQSKNEDVKFVSAIKKIFNSSKNNYGTRKIKVELAKLNYMVSRRKIGRIMRENGLVSNYTVKRFKLHKPTCNNDPIKNELDRKFIQENGITFVQSMTCITERFSAMQQVKIKMLH